MVRRELTVAEKLKISALSRGGARQRRIARELQIDVRQIRRFQRSEHLPIPTNALPKNLVEQICKLSKQGMAQNKIARRLQLNSVTVKKYQVLRGLYGKGAA